MVRVVDILDEDTWMRFRGTGIGASEAANLFDLNPFQSQLEFFHSKVGFNPKPYYNLRMAYGHASEQLNSDLVACYDGNDDNHAMNLKNGKKMREVIKLPERSFVVNDAYKHLFSSPDREIIINGVTGYVEAKDSSSMHLNMYSNKIPISHEFQARTQMMVGEMPFNILSHIIDGGRSYKETRFERNGIIFNDVKNNRVITETDLAEAVEDFWQRVVLAREASNKKRQAMLDFQMDKAEQYQAIIDSCEPPPDESNAYEAYLRDGAYSLARNLVEIQGNAEHQLIAEQYLLAKEDADDKKKVYQLHKNKILNLCKAGTKVILPGRGLIEVSTTKVGIKVNVKI